MRLGIKFKLIPIIYVNFISQAGQESFSKLLPTKANNSISTKGPNAVDKVVIINLYEVAFALKPVGIES